MKLNIKSLNIKLDKKKIIIITSVVLALILIIVLVVVLVKKNNQNIKTNINTNINTNTSGSSASGFTPIFMSAEEKAKMDIPADAKIQVISRDQQGEVTTYKIIKNDSDIIDPAQIKPISPQTENR